MCGAVIYQLEGEPDSENVQNFHLKAEKLKWNLGEPVASLIEFASKDRLVAVDGTDWTQGYIDFKPKGKEGLSGMNKGYTTDKILNDFGLVKPDSVLLVAGDSDSDYPMMQLAAKLVKEGKALAAICIDVGGEINDKDGLIDVSFKKNEGYAHSQIDRLYQFLDDIKNSCAPNRENVSQRHRSLEERKTLG